MSTDLVQAQMTPMDLIDRAATAGASVEMMKELFELKLRVEKDAAIKAFNEAFTAFKSETIRIVRDKENTQYSKGERKAMYTSLENMVATVTPFLSKHGLSHSWDVSVPSPAGVVVACTLTHTLGHSKTVSILGAMDESGAKNKLQQLKSSMTYLKVATFEAICGLASAFGNVDDDGNGAGPQQKRMDAQMIGEHLDYIAEASCHADLKKLYEIAYKEAGALGDAEAQRRIVAAKDKRKAEL